MLSCAEKVSKCGPQFFYIFVLCMCVLTFQYIMCEGFEFDNLMGGINNVLTDKDWGMHVLICFELSKASKQSLVELGSKNEPGLRWDFNMPVVGSENGRACFNIASRSRDKKDDTNLLSIDQKITNE